MKSILFVLALAACGGSKAAAPGGGGAPVPPASQCDLTARHMTDAIFKWKEPPPTSQDNVFSVLRAHCNDDKWTQDAMDCFQKVTDEQSSAPCAEKLTKDQLEKVMGDMYKKFDEKKQGMPANAPGGGAPDAEGADPCEGGE